MVSDRTEKLRLHTQQHVVVTGEDSVLCTELGELKSQEEDDPKCVLWYKSMTWFGVIRSDHRNEYCLTVSDRSSLP